MDLPTVTALLWILFFAWIAWCSRRAYRERRKGSA
jgi:hypothetical protein